MTGKRKLLVLAAVLGTLAAIAVGSAFGAARLSIS